MVPPIAAAQPVDPPRGYGLLAEVEGVPVRAAASRRAEAALPPLRARSAAHEDRGPADEPPETLDPQHRVIKDEPVPTKKKAPTKKKGGASDEDEDLLP